MVSLTGTAPREFCQMWNKHIKPNCGTNISNQTVEQTYQTKLWNKHIKPNCGTNISNQTVEQTYQTKLWNKHIKPNC